MKRKSSFKKGHKFFGNVDRPRDSRGRFIYQYGTKSKKCLECDNLILKRSTFCKTCANKGKRSPFYVHGKNSENWSEREVIKGTFKYRKWRKNVFERDNYTCQECGVLGGYLQADHIKPFALFPKIRFDINNGRTLCLKCHRNTSTYGCRIYKNIPIVVCQ